MKKKDVVFLCQFFYPEYVSSATLPFDIAEALSETGYSVGALVGYPKEYNKNDKVNKREIFKGIDIKRVKYVQLKRIGFIGRAINYLSFFLSILANINFLKNYKILIVYSNPPIIPLIGVIAKKMFKIKIIFVSFDVYPEIAINSGTSEQNDLTTQVFRHINNILFKNVNVVIALSSDMREFLIKNRNIDSKKIIVIPNWYKDTFFSSNLNITNNMTTTKFTISYLGNLGICQDELTMMKVIDKLSKDDKYCFKFAGHGNKVRKLIEEKEKNNWKNLEIFGFLQGEEYNEILRKSDCFVVSLIDGMLGLCSPSKAISYLMCGKPVICIMNKEAELAKVISKYNAGKVFCVGDSDGILSFINDLTINQALYNDMSNNARKLFLDVYEKNVCINQYLRIINKIVNEEDM